MKTTLLLSLLFVICGCATSSRTTPHATNFFRLVVVRPHSDFGRTVRLPIQLDGKDVAKIKNGDYTELTLAPGTYTLSSRRGAVFGHDFPPATVTVAAAAGERRIYRYLIEYGPKVVSYPVAPGVDMNNVAAQPFKAEWQEMAVEDFRKSYVDTR